MREESGEREGDNVEFAHKIQYIALFETVQSRGWSTVQKGGGPAESAWPCAQHGGQFKL